MLPKFKGELANAKTLFLGRHSKHEKLETVVGFHLEFEHNVQVWPWPARPLSPSRPIFAAYSLTDNNLKCNEKNIKSNAKVTE